MGRTTKILLLGDQTNGFDSGLRRLLHVKDNNHLMAFFERVHYALRLEIGHLPITERDSFPRFTSVIDLLARHREGGTNPALESALTCIHQLACFISYYGAGSQTYPLSSESYIVGLCTGLFAAAAISSSRSIVELLPTAVEAVLFAFRTGLLATEFRDRLELSDVPTSSWSVVLPETPEDAASAILREFCQAKTLPSSSRPYISALGSNSLTISGPPRIIEQMLEFPPIVKLKSIRVPIYAPYHAPHLYSKSDLDAILESRPPNLLNSYSTKIPIFSSATGELIDATDFSSLLQVALREVLLQTLRWDIVLEGCKSLSYSFETAHCTIVPIATNASQSLASVLRQNENLTVEIDHSIVDAAKLSKTTSSTGRPEQSKIAIIGLSGRFPDAASPELFWDLLFKGLDVHKEVPADRFDVNTHFDPTGKGKNTSQIRNGCWIENPGLFDARFFNMSPREAAQTDPAQRLAITTAYEALEMAGFVANSSPSTQRDRVGIFYGMTSDDWREVNSGQNVDTYMIPGGNRAFTPGRINYHFKFSGPSYSVDTACSSSLAAIHLACNSLWKGDCDTALAGGTNVMTNPDNFCGLDKGHFLSKTGNCKTFDDGADGYCRADGVGTVVLKRLEDAEADKDPIHGVILGAYTNHSAEAVSITRPHAGAQSFIFDKIVNAANVDPHDVSYIEMHGTGTQAGDGVEMQSVLDVFAPTDRSRGSPLHLGSAKANIGHGEAASGVTSLIKLIKMMEKNTIPPHCGIKTKINHTFPTNLVERNVHIASKPTPWLRAEGKKRKMFLNNFSAAGGNTALLIEDAPIPAVRKEEDPRSTHLVAVSAKSKLSLQKNIQSLKTFIKGNPDTSLPSLSYTTTSRRAHHNHRVMLTGSSLSAIQLGLEAAALQDDISPIPASTPTIAFAFTGQGAQYLGMGKRFFLDISQFRSDILCFDRIGLSQGFPSIQPLIDGSISNLEECSPLLMQLGTTCLQMAVARLWMAWGVKPDIVIGHSLGEYAALNVAGVLSASDTIYLTGTRARLLQEQCTVGTHSMLAVKTSVSSTTAYVQGEATEIACINAPDDTVVSGTNSQIDQLSENFQAHGLKSIKLKVPFAFHSTQVQPILESFETAALGINFQKPSIPVISPLLGKVIQDVNVFNPTYLSRHCRETVNFLGGLQAAKTMKMVNEKTAWVEIGSHPVCSGMIRATLGSKVTTLPSLRRDEDAWKVITGSLASLHLAGAEIRWGGYHQEYNASHEVLQLPAYTWDSKNHWIQYVHDWCLTKGNSPALIVSQPVASKLSTSSVQRIVEEYSEGDKVKVVIESDLEDPDLNAVLQAHKVNGAALCPSSVYGDIALTLANYIITQFKPDAKHTAMDVGNMIIEKPLIAKNQGSQLLRVSATADWKSGHVVMNYYSVTSKGQKVIDHAKCIVKYGDPNAWAEEWKRNTYLIKHRINELNHSVNGGKSHKIKRGMAYKLFSSFVEYDQKFRGMEEVVLDSDQLEATARIAFQATEKDGNFYQSPYWNDSLGHVSGFIMNANDTIDSKAQVFVNHGWDSMRCSKKFSSEKVYQNYVRMQKVGGTMHVGDVYIFEDDAIIAVFGGVKFQGIPRQLLDTFIPPTVTSKFAPNSTSKIAPHSTSNTERSRTTVFPQKAIPASVKKPRATALLPVPINSAGKDVTGKALAIIAEEIGVPASDLSNDTFFADFGVDSLLSLTIAGKFREELDVEVKSSLFIECPTVHDLRMFFSQFKAASMDLFEPAEASSPESSSTEFTHDTDSDSSLADDGTNTSVEDDDLDTITTIRSTLAEEIGVAVEDITGSSSLTELGMDSLMSLTVLGKLREEMSIDLPSDFFSENTTLDAIEAALGVNSKPKISPPVSTKLSHPPPRKPVVKSIPPATSILLQGSPKTASKRLFLFPDGSGSSTSYATLPKVSPDVAVYGLNCPYMRTPQDLKCGIDGLTTPYLNEVRRRQPHGPYYFGGWSAGGICAYDAAQQMLREGEQVLKLILLDSPFPIGLEKLPPRLYDFFDSVGLFGTGSQKPPEWLLPHFMAFIDALDAYKVVPFAPGTAPDTHLIWARDGVCKYPEDPRPEHIEGDPKEMWWLLENRKDLGSCGWDRLVGGVGEKLFIESMENANHFTLMEGENARKLSGFIGKAMV